MTALGRRIEPLYQRRRKLLRKVHRLTVENHWPSCLYAKPSAYRPERNKFVCRVPGKRRNDAQQGVARSSRAEYYATEFAEIGNTVFGDDAGGDIGTLQGRQFPKELEYEEQRYR